MGPRILDLRGREPTAQVLRQVVEHLRGGGFLAMPTETVYGFGCLPRGEPLRRLLAAKRRGPDRPFLLLVPGPEAVEALHWTQEATELVRVFWPGALTLILDDPSGVFPEGIRSPRGGVAIRMSPNPIARAVVEALEGPIVSTSANTPGGTPASKGDEALASGQRLGLGDNLLVLDGGFLEPSEPSTIIDCSGAVPVVVRSGPVPLNRLRCVLPDLHESA